MGKTNDLLDGVEENAPITPEQAKEGQDFLDGLDLPLDKKSADSDDSETESNKEEDGDEQDQDGESSETEKETAEEDEASESEKKDEKQEQEEDIDLNQDLPDEEVSKLSKREQGLYRALKQEREKRQETEKERDFLKLKKKFGKTEEEQAGDGDGKNDQGEESDEEDPLDTILKGKEDDDFLTAGEMKKLREAAKAKAERDAQKRQKEQARIEAVRREHEEYVDGLEVEFKKSHPDYTQALGLAAEMIKKYPGLALELKAENDKGTKGNPVQKVYEIAQLHKEFGKKKYQPAGAKPKTDVQKMIDNAEKQKTSAGSGGGSSAKEADLDSLKAMDDEELARTCASMSQAQWNKLPRSIRERALRAAE